MKTLFLSPHFDDVFLSSFARLTAAGRSALVVYPFARAVDETSHRWVHEESPNLREVGCDWRFLGMDSAERADTQALRAAHGAALAAALRETLDQEGAEELVAPLGIGLHPDHLVCTLAALLAARHARRATRVTFYSDIPYCLALPLLRGGPLQLLPRRWLRARPVTVDQTRKLAACRRYASQLEDDGTCEEIIARASSDAVSLRHPFARGAASYECYWTVRADETSMDELIATVDQPLPSEIHSLACELLPTPSDDTPFFSPTYAGREQRWSEAIRRWASQVAGDV